MISHFKLLIEYDGSRFYGWQRQADRPTVQAELERVLSILLNQEIRIAGSGRTDAGVHAMGQTASFSADTRLLPGQIKQSLNRMIKSEVVIRDCHKTAPSFHAQYSAGSKTYRYHILNRIDPLAVGRGYCWHIRHPLNLERMNRACQDLIGTFDFKSFENTGSPRTSTIRQVLDAGWKKKGHDGIIFEITATGFLKYMVRNIVGTLVQCGTGKIDESEFRRILLACDRTQAGPTAPPQGLFLMKVNY